MKSQFLSNVGACGIEFLIESRAGKVFPPVPHFNGAECGVVWDAMYRELFSPGEYVTHVAGVVVAGSFMVDGIST